MDLGPAPEDDDDSITTALHEGIAKKIKSCGANALASILDMVEKAVEQLFRAASLSAQGGIHAMV